MIKNILKFSGGAMLVVVVGLGAIMAVDYMRYRNSQDYRDQKEVERVKKEVAQDPYGGDTPEETLRLFVEALKKGDTDLAAKYFVLEKQEEWRADLSQIKEKGLLNDMIGDLQTATPTIKGEIASAILVDDNYTIKGELVLQRDPSSKKWRISEL